MLRISSPHIVVLIDTTGCIPLLQLYLLRLKANINEKAWAEELLSRDCIYWALPGVQPSFFEGGVGECRGAEWRPGPSLCNESRPGTWNYLRKDVNEHRNNSTDCQMQVKACLENIPKMFFCIFPQSYFLLLKIKIISYFLNLAIFSLHSISYLP